MKAIITGAGGTVGSVLFPYLKKQKINCLSWDTQQMPPADFPLAGKFIQDQKPDLFYHLAIASDGCDTELINHHWPVELARLCLLHRTVFVFTSTVMVYSEKQNGPYKPGSPVTETRGYGYEKIKTENKIISVNPQARIARLGWQIGYKSGSNNMVDYLDRENTKRGRITASKLWYPACSFLDDTAAALYHLSEKPGGIYLLDANTGWHFLEIVTAIARQFDFQWQIESATDFKYDQRMQDPRIPLPVLRKHLHGLRRLNNKNV